MAVDRRLVLEHERLIRSVRDGHHVHLTKFRPAFPPIGVCQDVMTADLASRLDLATGRHSPVEEGVVASHALACG